MSEPARAGDLMGEVQATARCGVCRVEWQVRAFRLPTGKVLGVPDTCEACRRTKVEAEAMRAATKLEQGREAARASLREHRLAELAIPPLYAGATLDTFELYGSGSQQGRTASVTRLARRYLADWPHVGDRRLLAFVGRYGTGKTRMGYAIARALVEALDGTARVAKLKDIVLDIRGAWAVKQDGEEQRRIRRWLAPDLLVIDEVTEDGFAGDPRQVLYDVVNGRYEQERATILTSHEEEGTLGRILGPALMDRIAETGGVVHFGDESYRRWRGKGAV